MRTMTKTASCLVLAAAITAPAYAELDDAPYFNLWLGTAGNQQVGQGDYLLLCGTAGGCNSDTIADANGIGTGYAIFRTATPNAGAGSGHIDPFLRFQHNEGAALGNATTEAAFNTSNTDIGTITNPNTNPDTTFANQAKDIDAGKDFNHAIRLGDLIVDEDGYFTFRLDINEPGGTKSNILLDELQIFVAASDQLNAYVMDTASNLQNGAPINGDLTGATKIWDMDFNKLAGGIGDTNNGTTVGNSASQRLGGITLDSVKSSGPSNGSGDFDMDFLLHSSLFNGISQDSYVYLYNFMGQADSPGPNSAGEAGAGFEEWAATLKTGPDAPPGGGGGVPEPSTAFLMAAGIVGLFRAQRSKTG